MQKIVLPPRVLIKLAMDRIHDGHVHVAAGLSEIETMRACWVRFDLEKKSSEKSLSAS